MYIRPVVATKAMTGFLIDKYLIELCYMRKQWKMELERYA